MFWLLLLYSLLGNQGDDKPYENYSVLKVIPNNNAQREYLKELYNDAELDFWLGPQRVGKSSHIMVPPWRKKEVEQSLLNKGIQYSVIIENVEILSEELQHMIRSDDRHIRYRRQDKLWYFRRYRTLEHIYYYMDVMQSQYPNLASIESIGETFEGRPLIMLKIGSRSTTNKKIIWIDACMHAREWISNLAAMYTAYQLLTGYESDEEVRKLVDTYDWYILPVANPDGFEYTYTQRTFWRKNRRTFPETGTIGVDLNRNFGYMWNHTDDNIVREADSEVYQGPASFSEAEATTISRILMEKKELLTVFITLHSYGELWLTPFAFTTDPPPDYAEMVAVAEIGNAAMATFNGTSFQIQTASTLYQHSGTSPDWVYGELNVKYAYALELGANAETFAIPEKRIIPIGEEIWRATKAVSLHLAS